jgi:hypothetical protein
MPRGPVRFVLFMPCAAPIALAPEVALPAWAALPRAAVGLSWGAAGGMTAGGSAAAAAAGGIAAGIATGTGTWTTLGLEPTIIPHI